MTTHALILKMRHALERADDFMTGFEDDERQEDMSGLDAVRFAIKAADAYLGHLTEPVAAALSDVPLPPDGMDRMLELIQDSKDMIPPTADECEEVTQYVTNTLLAPGNGSIEVDVQLQTHFPMEWSAAQDEIAKRDGYFKGKTITINMDEIPKKDRKEIERDFLNAVTTISTAINSEGKFVAVVVDGGIVQEFITNLQATDIRYIVIDYDDHSEEPASVTEDTPYLTATLLSDHIAGGARQSPLSEGEQMAIDKLKLLGL